MHELPVTQSIINICTEEAEKNGVTKVEKINIVVGALSDIVPDSIYMYFELLVKGTILEGTILNIKKIKARILCKDCGFEEELSKRGFKCSSCNSENVKILGSSQLYIEDMEVTDERD
ncbi:MAG TPA: hydrogenase maturation nickel metallochaperone HypA [Clostridiaceae bacterium]